MTNTQRTRMQTPNGRGLCGARRATCVLLSLILSALFALLAKK
jgi:hypothetical protein